ncbi:MAG TPA: [FeFe] hydrogenase H-cluster radical SAM maturase HydG [Syntrophorhabdaceae bacterium]|nr:[FeFe] hydrogenase H-cluster radical SAM maturase HydG [Syntrophorhabdaceae bacterium]HQE81277.1 [FeFe] hydrogenase H-cluster radical SAM maturase HydG [Syntrophorhabdaceae bacterium]HQH43625.1 [FeFe] hydrogenase H-cluster radical SAM maturase HydG [Syntrophorhabdaceae bacterium]HQK46958.1 [FeFe] hydrogenase H-cluster radical SAM maturase HydG [Syntrophorhabdaceae bacterium]
MLAVLTKKERDWVESVIKDEEIVKYMENGRDFIDDDDIWERLQRNTKPDKNRIRDIIQKSLEIQTLEPDETASLLNIEDPDTWHEIFQVAKEIKRKVYDNRIVTFAPLYCGDLCVNNCLYCGFRRENVVIKRRRLGLDEIRKEAEVLAGEIGHKRLIVVYGEHPSTDAGYIADTIRTIYDVKVKTKNGYGQIRRVNVNIAPMSVDDLRLLRDVGIGTYQVFQETYHHGTYKRLHPEGTLKSHYQWRLYCHHRALEAGVDDVAIGALFGLYDWRFEVMGLLYHARDLERQFGIGPHTISFPRLEPAANTPFIQATNYRVSDEDFKKIIAVIRLSVPYTGMILTAREPASIRREVLPIGITQTDASTKIGIGAYSDRYTDQEEDRQQFLLGDTRSLDEVIRELAQMGYITSFCTAGYRCGRTGDRIMTLLRTGREAVFCKLNAVLTFREWLDDFASPETKVAGEQVLKKEIEEIKDKLPQNVYEKLLEYYRRIEDGERDLYF